MSWLLRVVAIVAGIGACSPPGQTGRIDSAFIETTGSTRQVSAPMPVGQQVSPPYGFIGFCIRHPEECAGGTDAPQIHSLTASTWTSLNDVNDYVNRTIPQLSDQEVYGRAEWWAVATVRGGDCEDMALLKRRMLIARSWLPENLLVAMVREWNGDGHAVLLVKTDRGAFVLDNKSWEIVVWQDAPYQWISRQSRKRPFIWVNLDQNTFREVVGEAYPPLGEPAHFLSVVGRSALSDLRMEIAADQTGSIDASMKKSDISCPHS